MKPCSTHALKRTSGWRSQRRPYQGEGDGKMEDNQIMGNDIEKCNAQPVFKRADGVYADKYPPEKG
ncbi:hypothetical protein VNF293_30950 [Atlantibacter hermannii]